MSTLMTDNPGVTEEGVMISESAIAKFGFKTYEKRVVEFGHREFPIDLYADNPPASGFKITDAYGGNGVVCKIHSDDKEQ